ncbi:hypothetical protein ACETU7_08105 [Rhodococcus sp. 3Y1]
MPNWKIDTHLPSWIRAIGTLFCHRGEDCFRPDLIPSIEKVGDLSCRVDPSLPLLPIRCLPEHRPVRIDLRFQLGLVLPGRLSLSLLCGLLRAYGLRTSLLLALIRLVNFSRLSFLRQSRNLRIRCGILAGTTLSILRCLLGGTGLLFGLVKHPVLPRRSVEQPHIAPFIAYRRYQLATFLNERRW